MAERRQKQSTDQHSIDRISQLPDELLVYMLSFMTLKEASVTSILSRRWSCLWTSTRNLDFDGTELLLKVEFGKGGRKLLLDKEREKYVRWVNYVIASRKDSSTIDEFRVFFHLSKTHQIDIDRWLTYALSRKVQRLELNLTELGFPNEDCYTFPYQLLCSVGSKFDAVDFKYLKSISMNLVNVNGEALEFFLCNCPLLEELSVSKSGELSSLKVIGPLPSFKRLEICLCNNLKSIEIRDANLVYLKYIGSRINFLLQNVPLLVELFIGGILTKHMKYVLSTFSSFLPQLVILTIDLLDFLSWKESRIFSNGVIMSNLKQLIVKVYAEDDKSLLPLTNLICASPCLERFVLEALHSDEDPEIVRKKLKKVKVERSYVHLKEVVFLGYGCALNELELVMHFVKNANALAKIHIDPREIWKTPYQYAWYYKSKEYNIKDEMDARIAVKQQLMGKIPSRINLEIL